MACLFCAIVEGKIPATRIVEDEQTLAFMDINPGTRGHALVIPKTHATDIFDIEPDLLAAVARTAKRVAVAAKEAFGCGGVNLVQSSGAIAFQSVFHLHVHVIPRYPEDGLRLPWIPTPGDMTEIGKLAEQLRGAVRD